MEKYAAYQPPKRKGFYLDPRTKILFMAFITTLMFFVYENLAMDAVVAIIPLTLLLINRQVRTALIYGGLFALALVAKLTQRDVCIAGHLEYDFRSAYCNGYPSVPHLHVGLLHH